MRSLRHHPPITIWRTRQIECRNMQVRSTHWRNAMHLPQIARMPLHQGGRQQPARQQVLRPINVGHDVIQQARALANPVLYARPIFWGQNQGK